MTSTPVELAIYVQFPRLPQELCPQHFTHHAEVSAQTWPHHTETMATPEKSQVTSVQVELVMSVPFQSCPKELLPQHFTHHTEVSAQVLFAEADILEIQEARLLVALTGIKLFAVVPFPNCPIPFIPQHLMAHAEVTAQECESHAVIAITPHVRPFTSIGVKLLVVVPFPSCP